MKKLHVIILFFIIISVTILFIYFSKDSVFNESENRAYHSENLNKKENIEFGFNLNNFKVSKDTVKYGDSFGEIMLRNKLNYSQVYKIAEAIKDSFNVKWLTTGKPYTILSSNDSLAFPQYFIYQPNRLNYVVIDFL